MIRLENKKLNVALTAAFVAALAIFLITFAIGVPIYCRFFYYLQIKTLKLEQQTGWDYATIKDAYDQLLNFLTLPNRPFGTGELLSVFGRPHFEDVKKLFNLNLSLTIIFGAIALTLALLAKFKVIAFARPFGRHAYFLGAVIAVGILVLVALPIIFIGFDKTFRSLHNLFFPGKGDYELDPRTDEIIRVLPESFFLNCGIIIISVLVASAAAFIIADEIILRKERSQIAGEG